MIVAPGLNSIESPEKTPYFPYEYETPCRAIFIDQYDVQSTIPGSRAFSANRSILRYNLVDPEWTGVDVVDLFELPVEPVLTEVRSTTEV